MLADLAKAKVPDSLRQLGVSSIQELLDKYNQPAPELVEGPPHLTTVYLVVISAAMALMLTITGVGFCLLAKYRYATDGISELSEVVSGTLDPSAKHPSGNLFFLAARNMVNRGYILPSMKPTNVER